MNALPPEPRRHEAIYEASEQWNNEHPFQDDPCMQRRPLHRREQLVRRRVHQVPAQRHGLEVAQLVSEN